MITGLGTDIVNINRFMTVFMNERRIEKVFSDEEMEYTVGKYDPFIHFAGLWAAKEAYKKASGDTHLDPTSIVVLHHPDGKPYLSIPGLESNHHVLLSISHDTDYATATVIIERYK